MDLTISLPVIFLLANFFYEALATNALNLYSECICWAILTLTFAAVSRLARRGELKGSETDKGKEDGGTSLVMAGAIVVSCLCRRQGSVTWTMPVVGAALYLASPQLGCSTALDQRRGNVSKPRITEILVAAFLATLAVLPMSQTLLSMALSLCFAIAEWTIYNGGLRRHSGDVEPYWPRHTDSTAYSKLRSVSVRALLMSAFMSLILPPSETQQSGALLGLGILKAFRWFTLFLLLRGSPPEIGVNIDTFAIATQTITETTWFFQRYAALLTAFYTLHRTSNHFQNLLKKRLVLWAFALLPLGQLWSDTPVHDVHKLVKWASISSSRFMTVKHPVEILIEDAEKRYAKVMQHGSQTLAEAVMEYERRYQRSPPKGFDDWYSIAKGRGVKNIDSYDIVTQAFELYRAISPQELRESVRSVLEQRESIWSISIAGGDVTFWEDNFPLSPEIASQLDPYRKIINDTQAPLLLNRLHDMDLPRVVVPYDMRQHLKQQPQPEPIENWAHTSNGTPFSWVDISSQPAWQAVSIACPPDSPLRWQQRRRLPDPNLNFISDPSTFKDVCAQPELQYLHGSFIFAHRNRVTFQPIPIFTGSKFNFNSDILIPSPYYGNEAVKDAGHVAKPWAGKKLALNWDGSTTGAWPDNVTPNFNWHQGHRHRFVEWINGLGDAKNATMTLLRYVPRRNEWESYTKPMASQRDLYDVSFSKVVQCHQKACEAMESFYRPSGAYKGWVDRWRIDDYAFLLDMDGNGFSGRFYRLLGSNATVFKSTIFQEWHDDPSGEGLVPWVHYVPVSVSMLEVPELMRFFTSSERGRELAGRIADRGKRWIDERGRREDLSAGLARVVLEYKRLVSDGRDSGAMDYKPKRKPKASRWW